MEIARTAHYRPFETFFFWNLKGYGDSSDREARRDNFDNLLYVKNLAPQTSSRWELFSEVFPLGSLKPHHNFLLIIVSSGTCFPWMSSVVAKPNRWIMPSSSAYARILLSVSVYTIWTAFLHLVVVNPLIAEPDAHLRQLYLPDAKPLVSNFSVVGSRVAEGVKKPKALFVDDGRDSECLSPEKSVSWILNGECEAEQQPPPTALFSTISTGNVDYGNRTCGLCGEGEAVSLLRDLRDEIDRGYREKCQGSVVVYGAALGPSYEKWMKEKGFMRSHNRVVAKELNGTACFFQFVTNDGRRLGSTSADGSQALIVVDAERLPYENNRRNTKIFKLNPGLFFPWAKRIFWQDAKLLNKGPRIIPRNYSQYFDEAIARSGGACSSFMGLPHHRNTFVEGGVLSPSPFNLMSHCKKIIIAARERSTVSDGLDVLFEQCSRYYRMYQESDQTTSSRVFHQNPLVDSALIVWDMRSERCRRFNGNFGCSWLDEIHCYADRDQVSFPAVLSASGLHKMDTDRGGGDDAGDAVDDDGEEKSLSDTVYGDSEGPMLHIADPNCHWYYGSVENCTGTRKGKTYTANGPIVAVIVAGTLERFMLGSFLEKFVNPMIQNDGAEVDYYLSLTTSSGKAYRDGGYMSHVQREAMLKNITESSQSNRAVRKAIQRAIRMSSSVEAHARAKALYIEDSIEIESDFFLKRRREQALKEHPNEDPDLRFPIFDVRSKEIGERTADANRNLLRLHLAIQTLWEEVIFWEAAEHFKYDFVIFLRDDAFWLSEFSLKPFLSETENEHDVFIPSCDAREPAMDESELNDHILISRRPSADVFGNYYMNLFDLNLDECMDSLPERISKDRSRGCNSEMLLKWVIDKGNITVGKVDQGVVPFQRSANVGLPDGSNKLCFHKFCQSRSNPVKTSYDGTPIDKCGSIDWERIFGSPI